MLQLATNKNTECETKPNTSHKSTFYLLNCFSYLLFFFIPLNHH